jgi:hypothetical protein
MIKYAKIIDNATKQCEVGIGTNAEFYKSIGMTEMEVEKAYDGQWYLAGYAPAKPETKTVRTFSKFSIWVATHEMPLTLEDGTETTVWAAFEAFLNNAGLWTGWLQLVDLVEDNPFFEAFYPQAVEAFGKELVDQVLSASVTATNTVIIETPEEA